ncbi:MAG TPA: hypothetical protein VFI43_02485 [Nitrosospira sp.]|nr:hypothetical protein [Nitrosospira sp.]
MIQINQVMGSLRKASAPHYTGLNTRRAIAPRLTSIFMLCRHIVIVRVFRGFDITVPGIVRSLTPNAVPSKSGF